MGFILVLDMNFFCLTAGLCTHLAVPAQRQVFGIVNDLVVLVLALALAGLLFVVLFALLARPSLLPLDVLVCQLPLLLQDQAMKARH